MKRKTHDLESFDRIASVYDMFFKGLPGDRKFYVNEALKASSVLELACGTGRITLEIARRSIPITGVDVSKKMLEKVEEKVDKLGFGNVRLVHGDMRTVDLKEKFDLIIIPYSAFLHLVTLGDQKKALWNVKRHLAKNGRLIFDIFVPDLIKIKGNHGKKILTKTGGNLKLYETCYYDTLNQTIKVYFSFKDIKTHTTKKGSMTLRYCFRDELRLLLENCGYRVLDLYSGFRSKKLTNKSRYMVWVAGKR